MLRYKILGSVNISIDLMNNYEIIAMANWIAEENNYNVTLYMKRKDVDMLDMIEKAENTVLVSEKKTVKKDITDYVNKLLQDGFFDYYIDRYEYILKCFDIGDDILERERLGDK